MQGCFHCMKIFEEATISFYVTEEDGVTKALCPFCGMDSVLQFQDALRVLHQVYFHEHKLK